MKVTKHSWKRECMPKLKEPLPFEMVYTDFDAEQMMLGYLPKEMEDKWFIYYDAPWLYFHRSWTGHCIYKIKLSGSPAGVRVLEAWVNRNKDQYALSDVEMDVNILSSLIKNKLLDRDI